MLKIIKSATESAAAFIAACREKFGDKFDYSKVEYIDRTKRIIIVCPIDGEFTATPQSHIVSTYGCRKCGVREMIKKKAAGSPANYEVTLPSGRTIRTMGAFNDLVGEKFGCTRVEKYLGIKKPHRMWLVRCMNCDKESSLSTGSLIAKISNPETSCKRCRCLPRSHAGFKIIMRQYMRGSLARDKVFSLSFDEFVYLASSDCAYCGKPPLQKCSACYGRTKEQITDWGDCVFNGIDRVDSDKGYSLDNCVPCCTDCNYMKLDRTRSAFLAHIRRIAVHLRLTDSDPKPVHPPLLGLAEFDEKLNGLLTVH